MESLGKILIFLGFLIMVVGVLFLFFEKLPFNIGRLPGDILIKKDNFTFYFPLTTSLLISVVISLIFLLISKLSK
ncbi:DUF2905 domain-containing protein [Sulfurihydrogenibium sp.]|uniref:DUF2905 domain-containing protein n=1 Tax=Sulfurihydrogenibium sp. TaxID=2053621 RepID=UPI0026068BA9|nr:DUF2905 domain-containing protein [Sulfurihydrogenibium sp.]